jgi:hypothetical protein
LPQKGTPQIVTVKSGEEGMDYAKCSMSTANGVGTFVSSRLADKSGVPGLIGRVPLSIALDAVTSLKQEGESLRGTPEHVIAGRIDLYRTRHQQGQTQPRQ